MRFDGTIEEADRVVAPLGRSGGAAVRATEHARIETVLISAS